VEIAVPLLNAVLMQLTFYNSNNCLLDSSVFMFMSLSYHKLYHAIGVSVGTSSVAKAVALSSK